MECEKYDRTLPGIATGRSLGLPPGFQTAKPIPERVFVNFLIAFSGDGGWAAPAVFFYLVF